MSEFILIFRRDYKTKEIQPTPELMQDHLKHWAEWFTNLAANDMLARPVQRFDSAGRVVRKDNNVKTGPYVELRESIGGLVIVKANDYDEAVEIAESCPVLELGGNVEIRMAV